SVGPVALNGGTHIVGRRAHPRGDHLAGGSAEVRVRMARPVRVRGLGGGAGTNGASGAARAPGGDAVPRGLLRHAYWPEPGVCRVVGTNKRGPNVPLAGQLVKHWRHGMSDEICEVVITG